MNPDGTNLVQMTLNPGVDANPEWSPNGRPLAFESNRGGNSDTYVMNADGSELVRLTTHPAQDTKPTWSPDGKQIAFHRSVAGHLEVFVMDADGGNVTQVTTSTGAGFNGFPSWAQGHAVTR